MTTLFVLIAVSFAATTPPDVKQPKAVFENACDNAYEYSCGNQAGSGRLEDPTGSSVGPNQFMKSQRVIFEGTSPPTRRARALLADPKNEYLRRQILSFASEQTEKECQNFIKNPKVPFCLDQATGLWVGAILSSRLSLPNIQVSSDRGENLEGNLPALRNFLQSSQSEEVAKLAESSLHKIWQSPDEEARVRSIFKAAQAMMIERLDGWIKDPAIREALKAKVKEIGFAGVDCPDTTGLFSVVTENAFYNPTERRISYCHGMLMRNTSAFSIAGTILHEIAHSFDPCNIFDGPTNKIYQDAFKKSPEAFDAAFPFAGLLSCLRGDHSVQARTNPAASKKAVAGTMKRGQVPSCLPKYDQIGEAFADWAGYEVLPDLMAKLYPNLTQAQYVAGYVNRARGNLCHDAPPGVFDEHPSGSARINNLMLAQPKIRQQMGCGARSKAYYCGNGRDEPTSQGIQHFGEAGGAATREPGSANASGTTVIYRAMLGERVEEFRVQAQSGGAELRWDTSFAPSRTFHLDAETADYIFAEFKKVRATPDLPPACRLAYVSATQVESGKEVKRETCLGVRRSDKGLLDFGALLKLVTARAERREH